MAGLPTSIELNAPTDKTSDLLAEFVYQGIEDRTRVMIGDPPRGHGVLGLLIEQPEPIRLTNLQRGRGRVRR